MQMQLTIFDLYLQHNIKAIAGVNQYRSTLWFLNNILYTFPDKLQYLQWHTISVPWKSLLVAKDQKRLFNENDNIG